MLTPPRLPWMQRILGKSRRHSFRKTILDVFELEPRELLAAPAGIVIVIPADQQGPAAGGVLLTVNGNNLTAGSGSTTVDFYNQTTTVSTPGAVGTVSSSQLTVTQPPLALGTYTLVVTNADGNSGTTSTPTSTYSVVAQVAPTVTGVTPPTPLYGTTGQTVTVTGTSFTSTSGSTTVQFINQSTHASTPGIEVVVNGSGTSLTVVQPSLAPGEYDITVTTNAGTSPIVVADEYLAVAPALVAVTHSTATGVLSTLTSLPVSSTSDFTPTGTLFVQTTNGIATVTYQGKTQTSFTNIAVVANDPFNVGATDTTGSLDTTYPAVYQATSNQVELTFNNDTNLTTAPGANIYVAMYWSTAVPSGTAASFYYLDSPNSNGSNGKYSPVSSLTVGSYLPTYQLFSILGGTTTVNLPFVPTNSARFVIGIGAPPQVQVVQNSGGDIGVSTPVPNTAQQNYDYVEFTLDASGADGVVPNAQRFLPTLNINTSQVDQFGFPITLTGLNNVNGQGVQSSVGVTLADAVARDAIFTEYSTLFGPTSPYASLVIPSTDPAQPFRILNPGKVSIATTDSLGNVFDDAIHNLFEIGPDNLSLVSGVNQQTYTSTRTTVSINTDVYNVLTFSGPDISPVSIYEPFFSSNAPPGTNPYYTNKPAAPSWLTNSSETAGQMVFGNDGVFGDAGLQPSLTSLQISILADLENQVVAALNRGIANLYHTTAEWQTSTNFYPDGQTANLYAKFLHKQTISSTPIFIDGKAYAIAYDDQGGQNPTLVIVNDNAVAITLGAWTASTAQGTQDERWVAQVYLDVLNRPIDLGAIPYWTNLLSQGLSRAHITLIIESSPEARTVQIQDFYQRFLHRSAETGGVQFYLNFLANGGTTRQVQAALLSSPEYFQNAGGNTNAGYMTALYVALLDRPIDASGLAFYTQLLANGTTRGQVVASLFASVEYNRDVVGADYTTYLRRAADQGGLQFYANALISGMTDEQLIAILIGSPEYFNGV